MPALISLATPDGLQFEVRLSRHPLSIGRAPDNTVRSPERNVSRHHAVIGRLPDGNYEVADCGSSYGTFVNGAQVVRRALQHEDKLRIGDHVLVFSLVPALPTDEPEAGTQEMGAELGAARDRVASLVEQVADLRKEVGLAQHEEEVARKERDEVETEIKRLRADMEKQRTQQAALELKASKLEGELHQTQAAAVASVDVAPMQKQLREAKGQVEAFKKQIAAMEERDAQGFAQRKELTRITEELKQTRERMVAATASVQPAMARIEALTSEVKQVKAQLTKTEAELEEARRRK